MEKDAIFSLMSMTKPIVSTALMMLWEDGKFMLDDPISKWLPSYANKVVMDQVSGRAHAGQTHHGSEILTHTSGFRSKAGEASQDAAGRDRTVGSSGRSRFNPASAGNTARRPISWRRWSKRFRA